MPMSFFALHDLCPSASFIKYGLLLIYGKLEVRSGQETKITPVPCYCTM